MSDSAPPPPLEWHPAYRGKTWLIGWLDGRDNGLRGDHVRVPFIPAGGFFGPVTESSIEMKVHTLRRMKCSGLAPYVGHPFCYVWWAAVDELGRWIAADARRVYDGHQCAIPDCGCRLPAWTI